jgi:hypothetical protein
VSADAEKAYFIYALVGSILPLIFRRIIGREGLAIATMITIAHNRYVIQALMIGMSPVILLPPKTIDIITKDPLI